MTPLSLSPPMPSAPPQTPTPPRQLNSTELLQGNRAIEITHNGAVYRLYATRLGKLILTK